MYRFVNVKDNFVYEICADCSVRNSSITMQFPMELEEKAKQLVLENDNLSLISFKTYIAVYCPLDKITYVGKCEEMYEASIRKVEQ